MKKNLFLALASTMLFSFTNCSDDNNNPDTPVYPPSTKADLQNLYKKALTDITIEKTFDAEAGLSFVSPKGVEFSFQGYLYDKNGERVTGDVKLEYVEIFDRGNMVATNRPLMGYDNLGNLRPLITGGEFYVRITKNGEELPSYSSYRLLVPASLTGGINEEMILWTGKINDDDAFTWDMTKPNGETSGIYPDTERNMYDLLADQFGWTNIDILSREDGEQTPLLVRVPEGYDNKNASVYVAYKGKPGMLAFLDEYSTTKKLFTEHYGWAPIGYNLYVIFVTEHNGKYLYSIKDVTVAKNTIITVESSNLKEGTKEEVVAKINALP